MLFDECMRFDKCMQFDCLTSARRSRPHRDHRSRRSKNRCFEGHTLMRSMPHSERTAKGGCAASQVRKAAHGAGTAGAVGDGIHSGALRIDPDIARAIHRHGRDVAAGWDDGADGGRTRTSGIGDWNHLNQSSVAIQRRPCQNHLNYAGCEAASKVA